MTTIDPMTAPAQEVYDWLAERDGYTRQTCPINGKSGWFRTSKGGYAEGAFDGESNPITIDRLSEMLPEGYFWDCVRQVSPGDWFAEVAAKADNVAFDRYAPSEREARARVVAAVLMRDNP